MNCVICYHDNCKYWNGGCRTSKTVRIDNNGKCFTVKWVNGSDSDTYADNDIHGQWIKINPDCRGYSNTYECSNCKSYIYTYLFEKYCDYEFCPRCRAIMDKE